MIYAFTYHKSKHVKDSLKDILSQKKNQNQKVANKLTVMQLYFFKRLNTRTSKIKALKKALNKTSLLKNT